MPRKKTKSTKAGTKPQNTTSYLEKSQVGISLSAQAFKNLNQIVESTGLSKSKVFEGLVTGNLAIASQVAEKTISINTEDLGNGDDSAANAVPKIEITEGANLGTSLEKPIETKDQVESAVLSELKTKIKEHKADYQSLKKHAQEQEALVKKLVKQVEEQKDIESQKTKQEQSEIEAELKTTQETLVASEAKVQELEQQLSTQQNSDHELQSKIAEKEGALTQLQQQLDAKQGELDSANSDRTSAQEQIAEKEAALTELQQQLDEKQGDNGFCNCRDCNIFRMQNAIDIMKMRLPWDRPRGVPKSKDHYR